MQKLPSEKKNVPLNQMACGKRNYNVKSKSLFDLLKLFERKVSLKYQ